MKKTLSFLILLLSLSGCVKPNYEVNYELKADFERYSKKADRELADSDKSRLISDSIKTIEMRLDIIGASDVEIKKISNDSISVRAKTLQPSESVAKSLFSSGYLEFKFANDLYSPKAMGAFKDMNIDSERIQSDYKYRDEILNSISRKIQNPASTELVLFYELTPDSKKAAPKTLLCVEKEAVFTGSDIRSCSTYNNPDVAGQLVINTTDEGKKKLADATAKNIDKSLAIICDDEIRSFPRISAPITNGKAVINGSFTKDEVNALLVILKSGALPLHFEVAKKEAKSLKRN